MNNLATLTRAEPAPFTQRDLREVLGCFATGVAIVTTTGADGRGVGLTISSFNSVSLDPPLILWCIANQSPSLAAYQAKQKFTINILGEEHKELCTRFARPAKDKFEGLDCAEGYAGIPRVPGALAYLDCDIHEMFPGGDHTIIVGKVVGLSGSDDAPLLFHRGGFRALGEALN